MLFLSCTETGRHRVGALVRFMANKDFLSRLDRSGLRRALWLMRRQAARPHEVNPAAAQYDGLATAGSVRAEYRRRGWKIPPPSRGERS